MSFIPPVISLEVSPGQYVTYVRHPHEHPHAVIPYGTFCRQSLLESQVPTPFARPPSRISSSPFQQESLDLQLSRIMGNQKAAAPQLSVDEAKDLIDVLKHQYAQKISPKPEPKLPTKLTVSLPRQVSSHQTHLSRGVTQNSTGKSFISSSSSIEPDPKRMKLTGVSPLPGSGILGGQRSQTSLSEESDGTPGSALLEDTSEDEENSIGKQTSPTSPLTSTPRRKPKKVYLDKFKKHLIRLFRTHLHDQFKDVYKGKHYRWVGKSKRNAIYEFFTSHYNVPIDVFYLNEAIFARLIFNTVKDLTMLGIKVDSEKDEAMIQIFRKKPNKRNTSTFFGCEVIQKIWNNSWGGPCQGFYSSEMHLQASKKGDPREVEGLCRQLSELEIDPNKFIA